jgi:hypothetical protein
VHLASFETNIAFLNQVTPGQIVDPKEIETHGELSWFVKLLLSL